MIHAQEARRVIVWLSLLGTVAPSARAQERAESSAPASAADRNGAETPEQGVGVDAGLDENAAFARARSYYEASDYQGCEAAFSGLLRPDAQHGLKARQLVEQARIYYAACLMGLGKPRAADEQMKLAIRENPLISAPDPLIFPALVVDRFFSVRSQLLAEIRRAEELRVEQLTREAEAVKAQDAAMRARIAELEKLAGKEAVIQKNSRTLAAVPFGVGQFQNRDPVLGWFFLTSEALFAGAAITAVSVQLGLHAQADGGRTSKDTDEINRRLRLAHAVEIGALAAWLASAGLGILQAQLAFVPEFRLEERARRRSAAPARPTLAPSATPLPGGAALGLSGRF